VKKICRESTTDNLKSAIASSKAVITITTTGSNVQWHHLRALDGCVRLSVRPTK
jgi:hypothetical protein